MSDFQFDFRVTIPDRDPVTVTAGAPEIIRLERSYNTGVAAVADKATMRLEHLAFLAWAALRRRHPGEWPEFEQFIEQLEDLEILVSNEEAAAAMGEDGAG